MAPTSTHEQLVRATWDLLDQWNQDQTRSTWDLVIQAKRKCEALLQELSFTPEILRDDKHLLVELVRTEFAGKAKFAEDLEKEALTSHVLGKWIESHSTLSGSSKKVALYLATAFSQNYNLPTATDEDVVRIPRSQMVEDLKLSPITIVRANQAMNDSGEWEVVPGLGSSLTSYRPLFITQALETGEV